MKHFNTMSNSFKVRSAFTLIELLVIIAILAAILFPVFARARENARRSACQSNMKQIGLGFLQYAQDYDESFPYGNNISGAKAHWVEPIMPYVKSQQLFVCPSDSTTPDMSGGVVTNGVLSYAANRNVVFNYNDSNKISGGKLATFNATARTVLAMEVKNLKIQYVDPNFTQDQMSQGNDSTCDGAGNCLGNDARAATGEVDHFTNSGYGSNDKFFQGNARHLEGSNYLCVDGHVKWLRGRNVSGGASGRTSGDVADVSVAPQRNANGDDQAEGTAYSGTGAHALTFSIK